MSDNLTALASENVIPSLRNLLEDVQRGHIKVPRFQRPFIWTDQQRLNLLESIRDNMPIGSLLVWRTARFNLASFPTVGPHIIPGALELPSATGWQYLLDGHQRVSTLLSLLLRPREPSTEESRVDENGIDWDIQYDLMVGEFVFARKGRKRGAERPLLPLWTLFDGRLVNKHMRELRKKGEAQGWSEENLDLWEERADGLSYRFQQCRIPIVIMVTDELSTATKTFQRVNSLGTPMDEAHLVSALTWSSDFDLREKIEGLRENLPLGWRKLDDRSFLQVCKGVCRFDMTKAGEVDLVDKLKSDKSMLEAVVDGIVWAVNFLYSEVGVVMEEFLPYSFQLSLLAVEYIRSGMESLSPHALRMWFWRTGWSQVFGSASFRQIREEQDSLEGSKSLNPETWVRDQDLPVRFDFRSARVSVFILRLAMHQKVFDVSGNTTIGRRLLEEYGRDALSRLFSPTKNSSKSLQRLLSGPGNRFLINPADEANFRERLRFGPDIPTNVLHSHFIDQPMIDTLRSGDLESFLCQRAELMNKWDMGEWEKQRRESA